MVFTRNFKDGRERLRKAVDAISYPFGHLLFLFSKPLECFHQPPLPHSPELLYPFAYMLIYQNDTDVLSLLGEVLKRLFNS